MQLPPLLQPWAPWLSLFSADLVNPIGELLLRLSPRLSPLQRHAAQLARDPAGVGDIVQRGSYERLLISEWAYADAVPDEFIRRAANGELLFTGPEPAHSDEALCSIALFDAGPFQLGEPRLVHIAMFILLARRAAQAGAAFKWGVLQRPDFLFTEQGTEAIQHLLNVRTLAQPHPDAMTDWEAALDGAATDCWLVGDARTALPRQAQSRVTISRDWLTGELEVTLRQRRGSSTVSLALPSSADGVRLLRRPFEAQTPAASSAIAATGAHSLKHPPFFSTHRQWLAQAMADGGFSLYHVPDSPNTPPGRARRLREVQFAQTTVASGVIGKNVALVSRRGEGLFFANFPGEFFRQGERAAPEPLPDGLQLMPGAGRLANAFHLHDRVQPGTVQERVLILDRAGNLACWTRKGKSGRVVPAATVSMIGSGVIGAYQLKERLLFAITQEGRTDIYQMSAGDSVKVHLFPVMYHGKRCLFGSTEQWRGGGGLYALQVDSDRWLVGDRKGGEYVTVDRAAVVLGVGASANLNTRGLVVLHKDRLRIDLLESEARHVLVESSERIANASFDPMRNRLAWLGQKSGTLAVRGMDQQRPFLQTIPAGAQYAS